MTPFDGEAQPLYKVSVHITLGLIVSEMVTFKIVVLENLGQVFGIQPAQ